MYAIITFPIDSKPTLAEYPDLRTFVTTNIEVIMEAAQNEMTPEQWDHIENHPTWHGMLRLYSREANGVLMVASAEDIGLVETAIKSKQDGHETLTTMLPRLRGMFPSEVA